MADHSAHRDRAGEVRKVLLVEMLLNLLVSAAKGVYGLSIGSLAIAADGVHSLLDAASNIVGMIATGAAARPPDRGHPYGHGKIEILAAAGIGVAIALAAGRFAWSAVEGLIAGREPPATSLAGFVIIGGTFAVNLFVAIWEARKARQLQSEYLAADAAHTASDVFVTLGVMVAFLAAHLGVGWADPVGALVVIVVIARVAWQVLSSNLGILVDQAIIEAARVEAVVRAVPGVRGVHRVRSRGTRSAVHVDLHVLLDGDMSLRRAHEFSHDVEDAICGAFPEVVDVTVHSEPEEDGYEGL